MRIFETAAGITIKVGENAQENDKLVKESHQDYIWCHLENQPSPHAVIETINPDTNTINKALQLVKYYSKAKTTNKVNLIFTKIRDLTPVKNRPGMVNMKKVPRQRSIKTDFSQLKELLGKDPSL
ncbi:fibronectin/fibrinogen binding-related protein [Tritrichomonas foetus]|uniref:Fibronectin/fibrinogen binding-related protein n=1 Tax=Tritrichomonas foetus TaxID=1144522 RepID=A0A1J4KSE2_9EUKA|nr:fibronectin/fibrinogen binding-related protein [Tritrichomonas foetus]|eukprot:OHT12389.1 fibronectin/fibrinogen binding-related protein [Tritrichomonas foetus]